MMILVLWPLPKNEYEIPLDINNCSIYPDNLIAVYKNGFALFSIVFEKQNKRYPII